MFQPPSPLIPEDEASLDRIIENHSPEYAGQNASDYASFDPVAYVAEYYSEIGAENRFLLDFYHRAFHHIPRAASFLEFGGGPTIYQLLSARKRVREIVFAEYLPANRREVEKWVHGEPGALIWSDYLDFVLALEKKPVTEAFRQKVRQELRSKISQIIACDAFSSEILGAESLRQFDVVSSSFCLECITADEREFQNFFIKLDCLLRPHGLLVLTMLKAASYYKVGDLQFVACPIDEDYMRAMLRKLNYYWISIESIPAEGGQGYEGIIAITAEKG